MRPGSASRATRARSSTRSTRRSTSAFDDIGLEGPTPLVLFRESTIAGRFVGLTAVDGVADHVVLRSGRLPRECTPARCEVLRLRGRGALPNAPGLRLVQVGEASLTLAPAVRRLPAVGRCGRRRRRRFRRSSARRAEYHRPAPPPLVVAEGRDGARGRSAARAHVSHLRVGLADRARRSSAVGRRRGSSIAASEHASSSPSARRRSASMFPSRSCARPSARRRSLARACSWSAARAPRSSWRSRSWPRAACVATSRRPGGDSRGSARSAGSSGC